MDENKTIENIKNPPLQFTGNWFIDAGILGFVNLMEEVYGWDLEKLQEMIAKEPEKVYYGYFPIAFVYYNILKNTATTNNLKCPKDYVITSAAYNKNVIFEESWKFIENNYSEKGRIPLSSKGEFYYFHNFLFFQPKWKKEKQKECFKQILGLEEVKEEVLIWLDKTVNKFLPSESKFFNIYYTKAPLELSALQNIIPQSAIFILTFPIGFISIRSKKDRTLFYSSNIEFTYKVNKKIQNLLMRRREKRSIFAISWSAIIDTLTELKSQWALENMYLISYKIGKNQELFNVEFIGIPKLQASILLDDKIRENLNKIIQYRKIKDKFDELWLLEEFIKGKSLFPIILSHVTLVLNDDIYFNHSACLSSLIVEANILNFKDVKNNKKSIFSDCYFDNYKSLLSEIKKDIRYSSLNASIINQISDDSDTKKRIARELINALKAKDKNMFLYILLKNLNEKKKLSANINLNNWIFNKIIDNNTSFEIYGLILAMNLCESGKNE